MMENKVEEKLNPIIYFYFLKDKNYILLHKGCDTCDPTFINPSQVMHVVYLLTTSIKTRNVQKSFDVAERRKWKMDFCFEWIRKDHTHTTW